MSVGDRLRAVPVPDERAARERGQAVARAAFADRSPAPPALRLRPAMAAAVAGLLALVVLALTPPGRAVSDWLRDQLGRDHVRQTARPALDRLPAPGSLLVESPEGPWVVRSDGSKRLLGPYREATWSPQGRFVGVTRANGLLAVEPAGRVHWSLTRPRVSRPRWAPSGFRVAYLSGPDVRVVAGDGTGDGVLRRGVAAEWRPGFNKGVSVVGGQKVLAGPNILAVAGAGGRVRAIDADSRQTLWSAATGAPAARRLSWSGDGRRLLVATARALVVLDGGAGRVVRRFVLAAGTAATEAAFAPQGRRVAMVRTRRGVSELVLLAGGRTRLLFAGAGRLSGLTWSPDGRWLLVAWPTADEFLFVRASGSPRAEAALRVAMEFDPRATGPSGDPRPAGWCCSP
jgi:hypothetical protein